MTRTETDRNLLFGVLALQLDLIDGRQLAEACAAWAGDGDAPLADHLLRRGWVTPDDRAAIEHVIRRKLAHHGGDVHRVLASVADGRVAASLADVPDPGVHIVLDDLSTDRGVASPVVSTLDWPAESRGEYPLVRLHGRGGLGRVWLAHDPVIGRSVALKEIVPERADDPGHRARFLAEARITGQLQHPGIVPVYEVSSRPEDDRPFYTMRFVRGRTLSQAVRDHHARQTDGCRGDALELSGLLGAFIAVCNAIAYAHSRGVIHRDLKGQNIVLGDYGEAIVLDWGLAKVIGRPEGDWPESAVILQGADGPATLDGQAVGTPGYMAPEQADGRHHLVGRASDIYGLGAVLYEILTGQPPFETSATPEAVRQVCERDPSPPRRVCAATPRALEAICLKALSKRREDRYATATELADDVRRYLANEPVTAWREPLAARAARWGRRHRSAVIVAACLLLVGLVGLVAGLVVLGRERARAEELARLAREWANRTYYEILTDPLLDRPGMDPLRRKIIALVQEYYGKLSGARPGDAELMEHLGWSYIKLARVTLQLGEAERATEQVRRALAIFEALAKDRPGVESYRNDLAAAHFELGEIFRQANLPARARAEFLVAAEIWTSLGPGRDGRPRPHLANCYDSLGAIDLLLGRTDRALGWHEKALGIRDELATDGEPDTLSRQAHCLASLGHVHASRGEWPAAESCYERARETFRQVLTRRLDDADRKRLGYAMEGLARVYEATGRLPQAIEGLGEARTIWEGLADEHPAVVEYGANLAGIHRRLGELLDPARHAPGDPGRSEAEYLRAVTLLEDLLRRVPAPRRPAVQEQQARALEGLAQFYRARREMEPAAEYERRAREARQGGGPGEEGGRR